MGFLTFVLTAVLSSALVSAALFGIISYLTPTVRETCSVCGAKSSQKLRQPLDQPLQSSQRPLLPEHHRHVENRG